ncbi:PREDICTED: 28S ribosomal protein S15, mitochondrial [Dufourea novaeangliae]|uniref:Small ribosomal subunit protein uS15m n=1 Tax=Dufourea novaeangliae TaxID=178035 RepID=A0A154NZH3_DUFNO|nr:PREDICTED: 28S ribosomal protein S15, mitochondrial [Dufourea novaeangliae]KZC04484.1 28S ribosomal protein S15, mitochondrial [Dufourea novaeangliae]
MNLATTCRLGCTQINNIYKFGGCVSRGAKTVENYKIYWKRPKRVPEYHPLKSGDRDGVPVSVKPFETRFYYENSKEWEGASDIVKKIFSLEFQPARETRNVLREKTMGLVKRHASDRGSSESHIAAMTSEIQYVFKHFERNPRDKKGKVFIKELVDRRNMYLKYLRKWDYRRFEWILERLNLVYKPQPEVPGMVSRRESITRLTEEYCNNIIQNKRNAYQDELKVQKKEFYREKAELLEFILKEESECGVTPTVTEEEIEATRKLAE